VIEPLRKRTKEGALYLRPRPILEHLEELLELSRDDLLTRCLISDKSDPTYIPSECLMYLVRARRFDNSDAFFERLYKALATRVLKALPRSHSRKGKQEMESLKNSQIRDQAFGHFCELLALDRQSYEERLDYYELRFDGAVANLRRDAREQAWAAENRSVPLEINEESNEPSPEVNRALGHEDPFSPEKINEADYRFRLAAAIDALPPEQSRIVTMISRGVPIDSTDPYAITIAKTLGKVEKTIRTHRDKAYEAIRAALASDKKK
jgi:hypothetical protein